MAANKVANPAGSNRDKRANFRVTAKPDRAVSRADRGKVSRGKGKVRARASRGKVAKAKVVRASKAVKASEVGKVGKLADARREQ